MKHYLPGRSDKKTKGEGLSPGSLTSGRPNRGMLGLWLGVKAALGTSRFQPPCLSVSRLSSPPADGSVHHEMVSLPRAGAVCDREWASHSEEDTREAARLAVRGGGESGREGDIALGEMGSLTAGPLQEPPASNPGVCSKRHHWWGWFFPSFQCLSSPHQFLNQCCLNKHQLGTGGQRDHPFLLHIRVV